MNRSTPGLPVHHQLPSLLRLTSIESVMPSSHLILCRPQTGSHNPDTESNLKGPPPPICFIIPIDFPDNLVVKNPPAMQETRVQFLGWEDPLEKEMATNSSILAWEILWTEEPGRLPVQIRSDQISRSVVSDSL